MAKKVKSNTILDTITPAEAIIILKMLVKDDAALTVRAQQIATQLLQKVDDEQVAEEVFGTLESIAVEDVWEQSGDTRYGYADPTEVAFEMFDSAMESYLKELKRYQGLKMYDEARLCCRGMLKGLHRFKTESKSEYKNWASDAPSNYVDLLLDEWGKSCPKEDKVAMERWAKQVCSGLF